MNDEPPTFASLGLSEPLVRVTTDRGYVAPTPVQIEVIPSALSGGDVWASAPTGSGKTASFVLPILQRLAEGPPRAGREISALILAPTRELAAQIGECVVAYRRHVEARIVSRVIFGGVSINPQMMALRGGADVVVATPGRLLDLVSKNAVALSKVRVLVLDEADRLLQQGFREELERILELVPAARQTLLFSATFPKPVEALAEAALRSPTRVTIDEPSEAPAIVQRAIEVDRPRRTQLLRHLLMEEPSPETSRVLVFVATKYATGHVARKLNDLGFSATAMSGKLSQGARTAALDAFHRGEVRVLVATDVAGRGLDVEGISMVVNYDLPRAPADYLHRIGRTARAGATGVAVSFLTAESRGHFRVIEKRQRLRIEREQIEGFEPIEEEDSAIHTQGVGGIKGKRKSKKDKLREAAARAREEESS